jgi:dTDP-4-dehydrorhamnose reductase
MLGRDLLAAAPGNVALHAARRADLDIRDFAAVERLICTLRPEWVLNAAAYTQVDRAEVERNEAAATNGHAVAALGEICSRHAVAIVHFSTDYVFGGDGTRPYRENDPCGPVNEYGRSKLLGERGLLESGAHALILRTQWLFGHHGRCFPLTMWERALKGLPTRVVDDQFGRPTYTHDLASATWALIHRRVRGIFHVANSGEATWFDVALRVFSSLRAEALVQRCTTPDYPAPARRPAYGVLDTHRLGALGLTLPPWPEALDSFLVELSRSVHPVNP